MLRETLTSLRIAFVEAADREAPAKRSRPASRPRPARRHPRAARPPQHQRMPGRRPKAARSSSSTTDVSSLRPGSLGEHVPRRVRARGPPAPVQGGSHDPALHWVAGREHVGMGSRKDRIMRGNVNESLGTPSPEPPWTSARTWRNGRFRWLMQRWHRPDLRRAAPLRILHYRTDPMSRQSRTWRGRSPPGPMPHYSAGHERGRLHWPVVVYASNARA